LDWICADAAQLDVLGTAPIPPSEELIRDVAIPSAEFPSDHVSLCCDLAWRTMDEPLPDDSSSAQSLAAAAERSFAQFSMRQRPSVPSVVEISTRQRPSEERVLSRWYAGMRLMSVESYCVSD
jgi:hypothetical protein